MMEGAGKMAQRKAFANKSGAHMVGRKEPTPQKLTSDLLTHALMYTVSHLCTHTVNKQIYIITGGFFPFSFKERSMWEPRAHRTDSGWNLESKHHS